jgi:hypothetical protein
MSETVDVLSAGDRIELRFPARGDLIVLARLVTSAISARAGFDIEQLEDLRLAVGELCLLTLQGNDVTFGDLCLEFTVLGDAVGAVCNRSSMPWSTNMVGRARTVPCVLGCANGGGGMRSDEGPGKRSRAELRRGR